MMDMFMVPFRLYAHKFHQRGYSDVDIAFVV